jgi:hypothetical protein
MPKITVIDNEAMSLWFHTDSKIVHHKMKRLLAIEEFKTLLSTGADYLEMYEATKWLSDDKNDTAISPEANEWGDKVWAPRVIKAGFKYWAVVMPNSAAGKLQMKRFIDEYRRRGVTVDMFDTPEDALAWLAST